ncbi:prophage P2a protein 33 [Lactobacillus plantarum 16] [Lactiplantibacillus mudanjiangensis]|nr:prophage P2a protein 33 [Lactobacillus plantarum 16] [Lactiplantibacillus mudanjiangensis]
MKYQKKPVIVNCFQWTGDINQDEDPIWIRNAIGQGIVSFKDNGTPKVKLIIHKHEGDLTANRGDYIIQGMYGEIYPCKPDIFYETYDIVEE